MPGGGAVYKLPEERREVVLCGNLSTASGCGWTVIDTVVGEREVRDLTSVVWLIDGISSDPCRLYLLALFVCLLTLVAELRAYFVYKLSRLLLWVRTLSATTLIWSQHSAGSFVS